MNVRVVTREQEIDLDLTGVTPGSTDTQILAEVERRMETPLKGYMVSREDDRVVVNPSPVFG